MKAVEIDDAVLRQLWADRVHADDIAAHLGVSKHLIFKRAQRLGLAARGRGKALERRAVKAVSAQASSGDVGDAVVVSLPQRGLTLEQAVALDGGTWAGRARLADRFGVSMRQVEQAWHRHRADPRGRRAG